MFDLRQIISMNGFNARHGFGIVFAQYLYETKSDTRWVSYDDLLSSWYLYNKELMVLKGVFTKISIIGTSALHGRFFFEKTKQITQSLATIHSNQAINMKRYVQYVELYVRFLQYVILTVMSGERCGNSVGIRHSVQQYLFLVTILYIKCAYIQRLVVLFHCAY